jgi:hypothetical protein
MSIISEMDEIRALAADLAAETRRMPDEDCATQFVAIFGDDFSVAHRRPRVGEGRIENIEAPGHTIPAIFPRRRSGPAL